MLAWYWGLIGVALVTILAVVLNRLHARWLEHRANVIAQDIIQARDSAEMQVARLERVEQRLQAIERVLADKQVLSADLEKLRDRPLN